jgi:hypothetical protein
MSELDQKTNEEIIVSLREIIELKDKYILGLQKEIEERKQLDKVNNEIIDILKLQVDNLSKVLDL